MRNIIIIATFVFQIIASISEAQSVLDTTSWKKSRCESGNFEIKYPICYETKNDCGIFYKCVKDGNKFPLAPFYERFYPCHDYKMMEDPSNYQEWIEYRARLLYSADGPNESVYGDSIVENTIWTNKYGIPGNIIYVRVMRESNYNGKKIKTFRTNGPVYVFKAKHDLSTTEPALLFKVREDQCDSADLAFIKLMFDNFQWISK